MADSERVNRKEQWDGAQKVNCGGGSGSRVAELASDDDWFRNDDS